MTFWSLTNSDFPTNQTSWPLYRAWPSPIMSGFHEAFATGVTCQQGTLTHPDTWFRPPLWYLLVLQLLRPDSSNLPCLNSTFHLEYPLVLSRFCFKSQKHCQQNAVARRWRRDFLTFRDVICNVTSQKCTIDRLIVFFITNALFKSILHIFDCYTIILQLLGERGTVKTIDRSIVHYWLVTWQMTSRNVKSPDVNAEYRRFVDIVSVI